MSVIDEIEKIAKDMESSSIDDELEKEERMFELNEEEYAKMSLDEKKAYIEDLANKIFKIKDDKMVRFKGYVVSSKYVDLFAKYLEEYNKLRNMPKKEKKINENQDDVYLNKELFANMSDDKIDILDNEYMNEMILLNEELYASLPRESKIEELERLVDNIVITSKKCKNQEKEHCFIRYTDEYYDIILPYVALFTKYDEMLCELKHDLNTENEENQASIEEQSNAQESENTATNSSTLDLESFNNMAIIDQIDHLDRLYNLLDNQTDNEKVKKEIKHNIIQLNNDFLKQIKVFADKAYGSLKKDVKRIYYLSGRHVTILKEDEEAFLPLLEQYEINKLNWQLFNERLTTFDDKREAKKELIKDIKFLADTGRDVKEIYKLIAKLLNSYCNIEDNEKFFTQKNLQKLFVKSGFKKEEAALLAEYSIDPKGLQMNKDISDEEKVNIFSKIKNSLVNYINAPYNIQYQIDEEYVKNKSLEEQYIYYDNLLKKIINHSENYPKDRVLFKRRFINLQHFEVFKACYNKANEILGKIQEEGRSDYLDIAIDIDKYRHIKEQISETKCDKREYELLLASIEDDEYQRDYIKRLIEDADYRIEDLLEEKEAFQRELEEKISRLNEDKEELVANLASVENDEEREALEKSIEEHDEYVEYLLAQKEKKFNFSIKKIYDQVSSALKSMPSKAAGYVSKIKAIRKPKDKNKIKYNLKRKAVSIAALLAGTTVLGLAASCLKNNEPVDTKISYETENDDIYAAGISKEIAESLRENESDIDNEYKILIDDFDFESNNSATSKSVFDNVLKDKNSNIQDNSFSLFDFNNARQKQHSANKEEKSSLTPQESTVVKEKDLKESNKISSESSVKKEEKNNLTPQESTIVKEKDLKESNKISSESSVKKQEKSNLTPQESTIVKPKKKNVEQKAEEIGNNVYDISYNNMNKNNYKGINDINLGETFTIKEDASIYSDEYSAAFENNGLNPYFDADSERMITGLVYNYNGSMEIVDIKDPLYKDKKAILESKGAVLEAVVSQNSEVYGVEGFYNIDDINIGGRSR